MYNLNYVYVSNESIKIKRFTKTVVHYAIQQLMPRMKTLSVDVIYEENTTSFGYCLSIDAREFEITLRKNMSQEDLVTTLLHEMIHVKQYARKELVQKDAGQYFWMGNPISNDIDYWDLPWEKDAYKTEIDLFRGFTSISTCGNI